MGQRGLSALLCFVWYSPAELPVTFVAGFNTSKCVAFRTVPTWLTPPRCPFFVLFWVFSRAIPLFPDLCALCWGMSFRWTFFIGVKPKTSIAPAVVLDVRILELSRLYVLLPFRGAGVGLVKG